MKTSARRVMVFTLALPTHWKSRHCGVFAIVRDVAENGESRPTVGAINKRITVSTIGGIKQLAQAFVTNGHVWSNPRPASISIAARRNSKVLLAPGGNRVVDDLLYGGLRRRLLSHVPEKAIKDVTIALQLDEHAGAVV